MEDNRGWKGSKGGGEFIPVALGMVAHSSLGRCFTSMLPKCRIPEMVLNMDICSSSVKPRVNMASYATIQHATYSE